MTNIQTDCAICRTYSTAEAMSALAVDWRKLNSSWSLPTSDYEWISACASHFLDDSQVNVVAVRDDKNTISAVAPLARPGGMLKPLVFLGQEAHGEPGDFSYRDTASLERLAQSLASGKKPLMLARIPAESPVVTAIKQAYEKSGLVFIRPAGNCPYIELQADGEQTCASLPKRMRNDLRRAARRAAEIGEVSYEIHTPVTAEQMMPLWQATLEVEVASWKGREESALIKDEKLKKFFEEYLLRAAEAGILRICFMKIDNKPAAMQIALQSGQRFWLLKIGYDEAYSRCSPGMLMMERTLRYAADEGLQAYEFLGAVSAWTGRWTKTERENVTILVYPFSLQGLLMLSGQTTRFLSQKIKNRLCKE